MKLWYWIILCSLISGLLLAEKVFIHDENHVSDMWQVIPGFYLIIGFAGCLLIIIVSKFLGKKILQKRENYYDVD